MRLPPKSFPSLPRLRNLARMEDFQQCRVYDQRLRLAYELGEYAPPQRLQKAPELLQPPVEGGRVESCYPRKEVREEPLGIPQERTFALCTPRSCWKRARAITSESERRFMDS